MSLTGGEIDVTKGYLKAIELLPGMNRQINTERPDPEPPEGFIDNTVKLGRLQSDGSVEWYGTMEPFPEGLDKSVTAPGQGNRERRKEDMAKPRADRDELREKAKAMIAGGMNVKAAAKQLGIPHTTLYGWLKQETKVPGTQPNTLAEAGKRITPPKKKQTPTPKPAQAANQEPVQRHQEPAKTSIPQVAQADASKAFVAPMIQETTEEAEVKERLQAIREDHYEPAGDCWGTATTATGEIYPIGECEDEEPIPYQVVAQHDLTDVKLELIQTVLDTPLPGKVALALVAKITDMEVAI
jgi:hypothetical protein